MKEEKKGMITKLKEKNTKIKDGIDKEVGKKVFNVFRIIMIVLFWVVIPITAVALTTLAGSGTIAYVVYQAVIWPLWIVLLISFVIWTYFKDFRDVNE